MAERADSAPSAAWLWNLPVTMLWMKSACFSEPACARLSEKLPVTENSPGLGLSGFLLPLQVHGSSPPHWRGPGEGEWELPRVPKKRSLASKPVLPNWHELKLTWTSLGYRRPRGNVTSYHPAIRCGP